MSRKHFKDIAARLKDLKPDNKLEAPGSAYELWVNTVKSMAILCGRYNNHFDRQRFYAACGLD